MNTLPTQDLASFRLDLSVRDYECDMQGIVNNAVYQNYLEHCRHEFLKSLHLDFAALTAQGHHLVVIRAELDYLQPLRSGDRFCVHLSMHRVSKLRFAFRQTIIREPQGAEKEQVMLRAVIFASGINPRGRPALPECISALLEQAPTL